jgi:hypothetical protein
MLWIMKILTLVSFLCLHALATSYLSAQTMDEPISSDVRFRIILVDGSIIQAQTTANKFQMTPIISGETMTVNWKQIENIAIVPANEAITISFQNGDKLSGKWHGEAMAVKTSFGKFHMPYDKITSIDNILVNPARSNIALGKPATAKNGVLTDTSMTKHLTDGNHDVHPGTKASTFSYSIDLRNGEKTSYSVDEVRINWKEFGDRFLGVPNPNGDGWARGSWPGDYVTSYRLEYRELGSENWICFHESSGRPVDEKSENVIVEKTDTKRQGASSDIMTILHGLQLKNVSDIRISAKGGHWIGLNELEIYGN